MSFRRSVESRGSSDRGSRRDRESRRDRGSGDDVMAQLFKDAQKASLEQKSSGNFITWGDIENGNVVLVCLKNLTYEEKEVTSRKTGKTWEFTQIMSDRVKVIGPDQKVKKLLKAHKDKDGNEVRVGVPRTDWLEDRVEEALEDGATTMMLVDHELVEREGETDFHKVVPQFGNDRSNFRKVLDRD